MATLYQNFSWTPNAKGNETKSMEEQFMDFCNRLNAEGWIIYQSSSVGKGKVVHCKTEPDGEFSGDCFHTDATGK